MAQRDFTFSCHSNQTTGIYRVISNYFGFVDNDNDKDILHILGLVLERYGLILQEYLINLFELGGDNTYIRLFVQDLIRFQNHISGYRSRSTEFRRRHLDAIMRRSRYQSAPRMQNNRRLRRSTTRSVNHRNQRTGTRRPRSPTRNNRRN